MDQVPSEDISKAMGYSDEQLFAHIGRAESDHAGVRTDDVKKLIAIGKAWWSEKERELKPVICANSAVQHLARGSTLEIAQAVYAAIFRQVGVDLAIHACVLIAKAGVTSWCEPIWRNHESSNR